jgi:hypothetical protein
MFEPVADLPYLFANGRTGDRRWTMEFVRRTIEINGCKLSLARAGKLAPS